MSVSIPEDQRRNYELFRDCLESALLEKISKPLKKPHRRTRNKCKKKTASVSLETYVIVTPDDAGLSPQPTEEAEDSDPIQVDDLADFTDYIATEAFLCLLPGLKSVDYHDYIVSRNPQLHPNLPLTGVDTQTYLPSLSPSITDSLSAYGIIDENTQGINEFLAPVLTSFLTALGTAPPPPSSTRADACEICGRDWINLTYHHLIPRFVHEKAVKRGWHRECDLQNVAWLCGACHRFVHRFAGHEDLARRFYSVELLLAADEVKKWAAWVGRLRWKGR